MTISKTFLPFDFRYHLRQPAGRPLRWHNRSDPLRQQSFAAANRNDQSREFLTSAVYDNSPLLTYASILLLEFLSRYDVVPLVPLYHSEE